VFGEVDFEFFRGDMSKIFFILIHFNIVKDLEKFPELVVLDRYYAVPPLLLIPAMYFWGVVLSTFQTLQTTPFQIVVWGAFISTLLLYHATFSINSVAHIIGTRRFNTIDDSRNNKWLAFITLGEGWHNNHHRFSIGGCGGPLLKF